MGLYDQNRTDDQLEKSGKWVDFGEYRVKIARAGGANKNYVAKLEAAMKPIRRAVEAGTVPVDRQKAIMAEVFTKTIIMGWQTWDYEKEDWIDGIELEDGTTAKATPEVIAKVLNDLPAVLEDIQKEAMKLTNFLASAREEEAKN